MKTRDIILIAAAGVAVVYFARRMKPAKRGTVTVPEPTPITEVEYRRKTRGKKIFETGTKLVEFLSKAQKERQAAKEAKNREAEQPWLGIPPDKKKEPKKPRRKDKKISGLRLMY